jgi:hypothetical protein
MLFFRRKLMASIVCAVALAGCAQSKPSRKGWAWPWTPEVDDAVGITTPGKRIEQMNKLQELAATQSPADQERVSQELAKQIHDEQDPLIRRHIVRTLGYYQTTVSTTVLKLAVADADTEVRIAACESWGRRGGAEAVEVLSGLLAGDTNIDVRLAAARAIGKTKDKSAVAPLAEALVDSNPAIQHRVVSSLKEVSGKDFGNDVNVWRAYAKGEPVQEPTVSVADRFRRMF